MAPTRPRKRKSDDSNALDDHAMLADFPAPPTTAVSNGSPARTPTGSPLRKKLRITQTQKQVLIDNLQLESTLSGNLYTSCHCSDPMEAHNRIVTERARKLRAQYAVLAQGLRGRIEMRVNRIPKGLRKANMGDLLEKHLEMQKAKETAATNNLEAPPTTESKPVPLPKEVRRAKAPAAQPGPARTRGTKHARHVASASLQSMTPC